MTEAAVTQGRGFVKIEMGPLTFTAELPEPMTPEQMRSLAKVSTAMAEVEHLFHFGGSGTDEIVKRTERASGN